MIEVCSFFITGEKRLHINFIEEFQIEQCSSNRALYACEQRTNTIQIFRLYIHLFSYVSIILYTNSPKAPFRYRTPCKNRICARKQLTRLLFLHIPEQYFDVMTLSVA